VLRPNFWFTSGEERIRRRGGLERGGTKRRTAKAGVGGGKTSGKGGGSRKPGGNEKNGARGGVGGGYQIWGQKKRWVKGDREDKG